MATEAPTIDELNKNVYLGKTASIPRPTIETAGFGSGGERLTRMQAMWDQAKAWSDHNRRLGQERQAQMETDRTAQAERHQAQARADLESQVKRRFMAKPGATESDWERLKGQLIDQALMEAPSSVDRRMGEMARTGAYNIV